MTNSVDPDRIYPVYLDLSTPIFRNIYGKWVCSNKVLRKRRSFCEKIKCDKIYRRKIIQTFVLGWTFFFLGWSVGIFGPCFPDLMLILDTDLETASWLFTVGAFGYLFGSMLGGIVYDRYNKLLLLFGSVLGMAITNGAIPWCGSLPLMLTMTFLCSTFEGSIETGGNADIVSLWGAECSPFMLAIYFAYSAGGITSPFVTQPFLAEKRERFTSTYTSDNASLQSIKDLKDSKFSHQGGVKRNSDYLSAIRVPRNLFSNLSTIVESYLSLTNSSNTVRNDLPMTETFLDNTENSTHQPSYGKTNIQYSFLIAATLSLSAAIPLFVLFLSSGQESKRNNSNIRKENESEGVIDRRPECLPFRLKILCLFLISSIMFLYSAIEDNFTGLLMTFCISHLGWSKSSGSIATSLNWASFAAGRFICIFLVRCIKTNVILPVHLLILVISFIGFLISSATTQFNLIWGFVLLVGFSMSAIQPTLFTWTEERLLPVTGKISSLYLVTGSAGSVVTPLLFGYLMEDFDSVWFVYLLLGMSLCCVIIYIMARITERVWIRPLCKATAYEEKESAHLNGNI